MRYLALLVVLVGFGCAQKPSDTFNFKKGLRNIPDLKTETFRYANPNNNERMGVDGFLLEKRNGAWYEFETGERVSFKEIPRGNNKYFRQINPLNGGEVQKLVIERQLYKIKPGDECWFEYYSTKGVHFIEMVDDGGCIHREVLSTVQGLP